jgi:phosphoribosylanthranilate isomerase
VFVDATLEEIEHICAVAGLTGVQLHGSRCAENPEDIGAAIGASTRVLHVVRYREDAAQFTSELRRFHRHSENECEPEAILIDSCVAGRQGGTGIAFDWTAARETFAREAPYLRLIAAGGLRPENIRHAIQTLQPWGVDVSSGVEASPGKKDPQRVANFIRVAREASDELCRPAQYETVKYSSGSGG